MAKKRHVLVGGGTASLNALTTIRELGDKDSEIVVVSREPMYSRMATPYYLAGDVGEENMYTADERRLAELSVSPMIGRSAARLDASAQRLTLDDGSTVEYDDLLIATGSSASRPPLPGVDGANVFNHWTLNDSKAIVRTAPTGADVVVVGAGFIAFTILNSLLKRGWKVTILEVMPQILPRMIDATAAKLASDWLERHGIRVLTNTKLASIEDAGGRKRLNLDGGGQLTADVVIMATGIKPNVEWLMDSGLTMNRGIVVDDHLRTNLPNVYAGGDIAEGPDRITGRKVVHQIEPTAMEHGRIVGANMAGVDRAYRGSLLMNIVDVKGLEIASFGSWDNESAESTTAVNDRRPLYRKYLWDGDRVQGAIYLAPSADTWGTNDLGMIKGLVHSQASLGEWKRYLAENPWDVKKAHPAAQSIKRLLPETVLGRPSVPFQAVQAS